MNKIFLALKLSIGVATADSIEIVFSGRRGYYGRQLVDIYIDGQNLSDVLIERGYGEVYK